MPTPPPPPATHRISAPPPSPCSLCTKSMLSVELPSPFVPQGAGRALDSPSEAADGSLVLRKKSEPTYKLEIICGVEKNSRYLSLNCYHVNFLAAASSDARMLFFAQVWEQKRADNTDAARDAVRLCTSPSHLQICSSDMSCYSSRILSPVSARIIVLNLLLCGNHP
ncbi:hypothetical protein ACQ4PT_032024 [Festuca glaucescens]